MHVIIADTHTLLFSSGICKATVEHKLMRFWQRDYVEGLEMAGGERNERIGSQQRHMGENWV